MRHDRKTLNTPGSGHPLPLLLIAGLAALAVAGCSTWHAPALRQPATEPADLPAPATAEERAAECARLRTDLRRNQIAEQEAPTTTTSPIIAEASEAKADRNIEIIKGRYAELNCDAPADQPPPVPPSTLP